MISTAPFTRTCTQADAVDVYSRATHLDAIRGTYPPADTGSSTLAVLHALKNLGWIPSYAHAFGLDHFLKALVLRPGICGIAWKDGCDEPDADGVVKWAGSVRGGHEIEAAEIDVDRKLVGFWNSWGPDWGLGGKFFMSFEDVAKALAYQGDAGFAPAP